MLDNTGPHGYADKRLDRRGEERHHKWWLLDGIRGGAMTDSRQDDGIGRGQSPGEAIQAYVAAWNAHDGAETVRQLAPGGTYVDPMLPGPIGGDDLARYVESLADVFPDVAFDPEDIIIRGDRAVLQWRMTGTNTGPLPEFPGPTGRAVDLPGVDIIDVGPDGIVRIVGYFDQVTFFRQLGVELQPASGT